MTEIITAVIALLGTAIGTFGGIYASARLTSYRIEQLEKKVDKHNSFAEKIPVIDEKIKIIDHRLDNLERQEDDKK